jgi:hypothetical protein
MKNCQQKNWIANPFQGDLITGISTKADEKLIDLSEDISLKLNFNGRKLTQFWLSVQQTCPTLSSETLKVLLPFSSSYICELGFSAMVGMKTKYIEFIFVQLYSIINKNIFFLFRTTFFFVQ